MALRNPRKLRENAVEALRDAVTEAIGHVREYADANAARIANIYAGRDPGNTVLIPPEGIELQAYIDEAKAGVGRAPETGANFLFSRLQQIVIASTPGRPSFTVTPMAPGAVRMAEYQEMLLEVVAETSDMKDAVDRAAFLGPLQCHVGTRLVVKPARGREPLERVCWKTIESSECGREPFGRRFTWHSRVVQWGSIEPAIRGAIRFGKETPRPNPFDPVGLTEVFDEAFSLEEGDDDRKGCRVHVFVNLTGKFYKQRRSTQPDLGGYVMSYDLPCSPLFIDSNLQPAPDEDVAPIEVALWVPTLSQIENTLYQIEREARNTNRVMLYDQDRIDQAKLAQMLQGSRDGATMWLPVKGVDPSGNRGISHTMRPVERDSVLGELLTTLQTYIGILDDVTGVGPQDRGVSVNPSKTATESATLTAGASRRHAARLRKVGQRFAAMARILYEYQRDIFGQTLAFAQEGTVRTIPVPDAKTARFSLAVALDEMENLSRRGRLESLMTAHTIIVRDAATFPQGEPRFTRESRRRLLKALGWSDVDAYLDLPVIEASPQDRYTALLEGKRGALKALESDNHPAFIAYYGAKLEQAVASSNEDAPVLDLQRALQEHQTLLRQRDAANVNAASNPSPVPGVSAQGDVDNQIQAQLEVGLVPELRPQQVQ